MRRAEGIAAAVAALCAGASEAHAYCRQTTENDDTCMEEPGVPLAWEGNCVAYSVSQIGSDDLPLQTVVDGIRRAFDAWEEASPFDGEPCSYLTFEPTVLATCDQVGYRQEGGNMNVILFRESGWVSERGHARAAMGLTTVLFDPSSGEILSADMELNGEFFRFTDSATDVDADLRNTATHEAGHMLGLAHTEDEIATMYGLSQSGETLKATLAEDDIEAVCDSYPIADDPGECLAPRGGLDTECKPVDGCGCRAPGAEGSSAAALLGAALVVIAGRRRNVR